MSQLEKPRISPDMLIMLAKYAGVKLSEDRLGRVALRVTHYLNEIAKLDDINTTEVEPANIFLMDEESNGEGP